MKLVVLLSLVSVIAAAAIDSSNTTSPLQEEFGYVEVRPGAHMFWVMYHVDQEDDYTKYPLILWLQGGPGASGVGFGNFEELGPYDINGNKREFAWTKVANVMFVDNPVGTGYSYVEDDSLYTTDNAQIAADLITCIKQVFKVNPNMENMPFFVFAESYGGKMAADFALAFDQAIKNGEVNSDFRSVALGDSWISPMDSVNTWGPYLYAMGFVNKAGLQAIEDSARLTQNAVDAQQWVEATDFEGQTEMVIMDVAHNVDLFNIHKKDIESMAPRKPHSRDLTFMTPSVRHLYQKHVLDRYSNDALSDFMNGPQADYWNIPNEVVWQESSDRVYSYLSGDFMKPVVDSVSKLLTETTVNVVVYSGNLDLICDTPGTYRWIENMEWPDKEAWMAADNQALYITEYPAQAATLQYHKQFGVFTILRSGHMVPSDAGEMALKMVKMILEYSPTDDSSVKNPEESAEKSASGKVLAKPAPVPEKSKVVVLVDSAKPIFEEAKPEKLVKPVSEEAKTVESAKPVPLPIPKTQSHELDKDAKKKILQAMAKLRKYQR